MSFPQWWPGLRRAGPEVGGGVCHLCPVLQVPAGDQGSFLLFEEEEEEEEEAEVEGDEGPEDEDEEEDEELVGSEGQGGRWGLGLAGQS